MARPWCGVAGWGCGIVGLALVLQCAPSGVVINEDSLHDAASKGDLARVALLLDAGEDVNGASAKGGSVLHHAALSGNADLVDFLLGVGADPTARTLQGETPLHWGASRGSHEVVRLLVKAGVDVNAVGEDGETPLDIAGTLEGEFPEVVKYLLSAGGKRAQDLDPTAE